MIIGDLTRWAVEPLRAAELFDPLGYDRLNCLPYKISVVFHWLEYLELQHTVAVAPAHETVGFVAAIGQAVAVLEPI